MTQEINSINNDDNLPELDNKKGIKKSISFVLCLIIIVMAVAAAIYFKKTRPKQKKRQAVQKMTYVDVINAKIADEAAIINTYGTVIPAKELNVKSRVSGEVVYVLPDLMQGAIIPKGTEIIRIDQDDYELAIIKAQTNVVQAQYALKIEQGHQDVAKQEWSLIKKGKKMNSSADLELILRKPHLKKVKADIAASEANLKQAQLNLKRTKITAPFNSFVRNKSIEIGSQITTQETLLELVGTDEYWIQVSLPLDRLKWVDIPNKISDKSIKSASISYRNQFKTYGSVIKCLGDIDKVGHMARLIVSVNGPSSYVSDSPSLLIGEYVSVSIKGKYLKNACKIPRIALRNNKWVWTVSSDNTLDIKDVIVGFRGTDYVLIEKGLDSGDKIIVSQISAPVKGMKLHINK